MILQDDIIFSGKITDRDLSRLLNPYTYGKINGAAMEISIMLSICFHYATARQPLGYWRGGNVVKRY